MFPYYHSLSSRFLVTPRCLRICSVNVKFSEHYFPSLCSRNFNCLLQILNSNILFFYILLKFPCCLNVTPMVFLISISRTPSLLHEVSSSSARKLSRINLAFLIFEVHYILCRAENKIEMPHFYNEQLSIFKFKHYN